MCIYVCTCACVRVFVWVNQSAYAWYAYYTTDMWVVRAWVFFHTFLFTFILFTYRVCVTIVYIAEKYRFTKFVTFNEFGYRRVNMALYQPSIRDCIAVVCHATFRVGVSYVLCCHASEVLYLSFDVTLLFHMFYTAILYCLLGNFKMLLKCMVNPSYHTTLTANKFHSFIQLLIW